MSTSSKSKKSAINSSKKKVTKKAALKVKSKKAIKQKKLREQEDIPVVKRGKGFSKSELNTFKKMIVEKKKETLEDFQIQRESIIDPMTGEYTRESSSYSMHMEFGTDAMEREKNFLLAAREVRFLGDLDEALRRIDKGIFGWCKDCGKLIEKKRLEAVPHATLCVSCKNTRGGTPVISPKGQ
jgi:RNA polymerase-binding protein DksA